MIWFLSCVNIKYQSKKETKIINARSVEGQLNITLIVSYNNIANAYYLSNQYLLNDAQRTEISLIVSQTNLIVDTLQKYVVNLLSAYNTLVSVGSQLKHQSHSSQCSCEATSSTSMSMLTTTSSGITSTSTRPETTTTTSSQVQDTTTTTSPTTTEATTTTENTTTEETTGETTTEGTTEETTAEEMTEETTEETPEPDETEPPIDDDNVRKMKNKPKNITTTKTMFKGAGKKLNITAPKSKCRNIAYEEKIVLDSNTNRSACLVNKMMSFSVAKRYCEFLEMKLFMINSGQIQQTLFGLLEKKAGQNETIFRVDGLYNSSNEKWYYNGGKIEAFSGLKWSPKSDVKKTNNTMIVKCEKKSHSTVVDAVDQNVNLNFICEV
jgi:hypothetical protein